MRLVAHRTGGASPLRVAPRTRAWMDAIPHKFAYRCLPLCVANQLGWQLLTTSRVEAEWTGGTNIADMTVTGPAQSHFGHGLLTFQPGYLFRTSHGVQLLTQGPLNEAKDGISALAGVVETDWAVATWTMNWRFTRPGRIVFDEGEPFCQIIPLELNLLEEARPTVRDTYGALQAGHAAWAQSRGHFNGAPHGPKEWEGDYTRGTSPAGIGAAHGQHRTKLRMRRFEELAP